MKYKELQDYDWLYNYYIEEKLSTSEIAVKVGSSKDGVRAALLRLNIPLRSAKETLAEQFKRNGSASKKYSQLNDKDWLIQKYENEQLSLEDIQKLVKAKNHNSVRQALQRFDITIRNPSEAQLLKRKIDDFIVNRSVIDGCLLGDATLKKWRKKSKTSLPEFRKKNIFYDHVCWVATFLFSDNCLSYVKESYTTFNNKRYQIFVFSSRVQTDLKEYYERWYPKNNNYKKVVPHDIMIDETLLLHWFLDDGTTSWRARVKNPSVILKFCSESFTKEDQDLLCKKVNQKFDLGMKLTPYPAGTGWRIKIPESKTNDFFEVVGPCPAEVPSMQYKWKIRQ